jgi:hypothetical protein
MVHSATSHRISEISANYFGKAWKDLPAKIEKSEKNSTCAKKL